MYQPPPYQQPPPGNRQGAPPPGTSGMYPPQSGGPAFYPQQAPAQNTYPPQTGAYGAPPGPPSSNFPPPPSQGGPPFMNSSMPPHMTRGPPSAPPASSGGGSSSGGGGGGFGSPVSKLNTTVVPSVQFFSTVGGTAQPITTTAGSPPLTMGKTIGGMGPPQGPPQFGGPPIGMPPPPTAGAGGYQPLPPMYSVNAPSTMPSHMPVAFDSAGNLSSMGMGQVGGPTTPQNLHQGANPILSSSSMDPNQSQQGQGQQGQPGIAQGVSSLYTAD